MKSLQGDWYLASAPARNVERDIFTEQNPQTHAYNRRKVAALYSMTNLVGMEPHVRQCTEAFVTRLAERTAMKIPLNLQVWLQYWAFDSIALITVCISKRDAVNTKVPSRTYHVSVAIQRIRFP